MTITVESSGTQAAVVGTTHTLVSIATAKTFALIVDTNALTLGDELELTISKKALTGGTERVEYRATFQHGQADPIKTSVPVICPFGASFTLKQVAGTARSFDWSLVSL